MNWNFLNAKWPFFLTGPLLALLIVLSLALFNDNIGLSESLTAVSEYCDDAVANRELPDAPEMDWRNLLLLGILIGAVIAAAAGKTFHLEFGDDDGSAVGKMLKPILRGIGGGFLVMLGIQLAGDSVWGATAAAIQLAPGGWIFLIAMALAGGVPAILISQRGAGKQPAAGAKEATRKNKNKNTGKKK